MHRRQLTVDKYYIDREKGGYFSHLDPIASTRALNRWAEPRPQELELGWRHAPAT